MIKNEMNVSKVLEMLEERQSLKLNSNLQVSELIKSYADDISDGIITYDELEGEIIFYVNEEEK